MDPDEIARRASATCASNTSRTGRGKSAGDSGATINGRRRGATAFVGARTTLVGCSWRHQNHATAANTTSANSQRQPPRLLRCGRDDEDLELRRTRRLSHRPDGDPRLKSTAGDQGRGCSKHNRKSLKRHKSEGRNLNSERSPKSERQTCFHGAFRFEIRISSRFAGFRVSPSGFGFYTQRLIAIYR